MIIHAVSINEKLSYFVKQLDNSKQQPYEFELKPGTDEGEKTSRRFKHAQVLVVATNTMEATDEIGRKRMR